MAEFTKHSEITARLDSGDVSSVNVSSGNYASLVITLRDSSTVNINFTRNGSVSIKELIEMILTSAFDVDWANRYGSSTTYLHDERITLEQVAEWKQYVENERAASEHLMND